MFDGKGFDHMDVLMFIYHSHLQTFYYLSGEWEHSCFRASSKIYSLSNALWCWYWQFYVENIQTEYYHHFGIFNFSTLNFVLDENPIFCGCRFDGPKVKNWQNYIAVILALSWTWKSPVIFVLIEKCSSKEWNLLTNCHHK